MSSSQQQPLCGANRNNPPRKQQVSGLWEQPCDANSGWHGLPPSCRETLYWTVGTLGDQPASPYRALAPARAGPKQTQQMQRQPRPLAFSRLLDLRLGRPPPKKKTHSLRPSLSHTRAHTRTHTRRPRQSLSAGNMCLRRGRETVHCAASPWPLLAAMCCWPVLLVHEFKSLL